MIRKIRNDEYLKGYGAMSEVERREYRGRVGEWLAGGGKRLMEMTDRPMAKSQNIVQLTMRWKEPEVRMFTDGVRLLSALVGVADTWLPTQLYAKSAFRAVRKLCDELSLVSSSKFQVSSDGAKGGDNSRNAGNLVITDGQKRRIVEKYVKKAMKRVEEKRGNAMAGPSAKPTGAVQAKAAAPSLAGRAVDAALVPVRPKHIDQYVHLLPEKTQERAAQYGPLMREMGEARENLRLLADDPNTSAKSREQWAKLVTKTDGQVKAIREELDAEWAKLVEQGRVVVDDLGQAHVVEMRNEKGEMRNDDATALSSDAEHQPSAINPQPSLTSEQKARRRELRKFLTDTRRGNGKTREEHVAKWQEAWKEYLTLEPQEAAMKDEKILAAIKHYEITNEEQNIKHIET